MGLIDNAFVRWRRSGLRGFTRAQSLWLALGGRREIYTETKFGSRFALSPQSVIDDAVLRYGYYESEVLEAIAGNLSPNSVFWDIGSNFGLHSVTIKLTKPDVHVYAFEPNALMAARVQQHADMNALNINIVCAALSNSDGPQLLHIPNEGNPGMATLSPWDKASYERTCIVPCLRAETLLNRKFSPFPNVVKLDVEGIEEQVLEGFGDALRSPALQASVFESSSEDNGPGRLLRDAGFKIRKLNRNEGTEHNLHNFVAER